MDTQSPPTADPALNALFGIAPGEHIDLGAAPERGAPFVSPALAARAEHLGALLEERPELRDELMLEAAAAWDAAAGDRRSYLDAIAKARAEVLNRLELEDAADRAPRALADLKSELASYLTHIDRMSGGAALG